jgi:hypothetical protein
MSQKLRAVIDEAGPVLPQLIMPTADFVNGTVQGVSPSLSGEASGGFTTVVSWAKAHRHAIGSCRWMVTTAG